MSYNYKGIVNNPEERQRVIYPFCFWNDTFNEKELDSICEILSNAEKKDASISSSKVIDDNRIPSPAVDNEIRRSKISFHVINNENEWIFNRLNSLIETVNNRWYNFDLNGYDQIQYTEYHESNLGHYGWHSDIFLGVLPKDSYIVTRKLSISLLLNDPEEFEGGQLQFGHESNFETAYMKKGTAIIFPSFQLHRVTPVTRGVRKSLVVWVVAPKFK